MAIHFLPILKAVAPYLAQVATAALPAFTSRLKAEKSDHVVGEQIQELQEAVTQNAQSIHVLAEKLQQAIQGIEDAAHEVQKRIYIYKLMIAVSLGLSAASLSLCMYILI